jgi:putative transposase
VDAGTGDILCPLYPLDQTANASGERGLRKPAVATAPLRRDEVAPLLSKLMAEFAATGLPPPYLPEEEDPSS